MNQFDPFKLFGVLKEHEVDFLVIGGIAGRVWGSPTVTRDLDICAARVTENLKRLAETLNAMHARFRDAEDAPVKFGAAMLGNLEVLILTTDFGNLDILMRPKGTEGYSDLVRRAEEIDVNGLSVQVTSLEDLIRMKEATGRKKDQIEIEILEEVLEEQAEQDETE